MNGGPPAHADSGPYTRSKTRPQKPAPPANGVVLCNRLGYRSLGSGASQTTRVNLPINNAAKSCSVGFLSCLQPYKCGGWVAYSNSEEELRGIAGALAPTGMGSLRARGVSKATSENGLMRPFNDAGEPVAGTQWTLACHGASLFKSTLIDP